MDEITTSDVRRFWEAHPLSADAIPFEPGTAEFFERHRQLREAIEPPELQRTIYEWDRHAGKRVLDVGCGTGFVVSLYARGGARVVGIDLTWQGIRLTRGRLGLAGLPAMLQQADAERLPFRDESFDLVTSFGVLHHTPDTAAAVREVHRVLKPGGRTIMMFYHRQSFAYQVLFPLKRLLQRPWRGRTAAEQVNAVDGPENPLGRVFSRAELGELLAGFDDLEFASTLLFFRWKHLIPRPLVLAVQKRWGWFLYVKARKPAGPSNA